MFQVTLAKLLGDSVLFSGLQNGPCYKLLEGVSWTQTEMRPHQCIVAVTKYLAKDSGVLRMVEMLSRKMALWLTELIMEHSTHWPT